MAESYVAGTGKCGKCGGSLHTLDDEPTDDSAVTCQVCGEQIGTYGEVNAKIRDAVMAKGQAVMGAAINDFRRSIKRINMKLR